MTMRTDPASFSRYAAGYDGVARFLHWLVVLLIAAQFVIGWTMPDIHKGTRPDGLIAWHLGVGATLIAAVVVRIVWLRFAHHTWSSLSRAGGRAFAGMGQCVFARMVRQAAWRAAVSQHLGGRLASGA